MKTLRAHGFNQRPRFEQVVGYLERNEPLLDQPDRKATSLFVTSHFYLDDFVQSSEDPNPQPLQHTPLHPEDGFRTPAEATDEDVRLARRYQGYGGTRFVEDDLAGDPKAGAFASNAQAFRPPSRTACAGLQTARSTSADLKCVAPSGPGRLPGLTLSAASWTRRGTSRLNVLPRPERGAASHPQDHRPAQWQRSASWARRGRCAQEVERGAEAFGVDWGAVAAKEGEAAVGAQGAGGALLGTLAGAGGSWPRRQRRGWPLALRAAQPTALRAARAGSSRTRCSGPSRAARTRPCRTSGPPTT